MLPLALHLCPIAAVRRAIRDEGLGDAIRSKTGICRNVAHISSDENTRSTRIQRSASSLGLRSKHTPHRARGSAAPIWAEASFPPLGETLVQLRAPGPPR